MGQLSTADRVTPTSENKAERRSNARNGAQQRSAVLLLALLGLLVFSVALSLAVGTRSIHPTIVIRALTSYDPTSTDHLVIGELRFPRTVIGVCVGAALGVAGVLMQGITKNPLADPGILGVNAGAAFAVVLAIWLLDVSTPLGLIWFAFSGAAFTSIAVYLLGSVGPTGMTPVRLALAGVAVSALFGSMTGAVALLNQATLNQFRAWVVGSLANRDPDVVTQLWPFLALGLAIAFAVARPINGMELGEDTARSLGVHVTRTRIAAAFSITLLCGVSVAAAGPVAFVGLVIPHVARSMFGADQRWMIPAAALLGPIMLLVCDVVGRVVARPGEIQVGVMTAAIGGPSFVALVRRTSAAEL